MNDIRIETKDKKAYVYTPYNKNFVQKIKKIRCFKKIQFIVKKK